MTNNRPTRADICAKFDAGEISWQQVFEMLERAAKPWESSEWKRRRAEVLGHKCDACGSTEPPLYVQHSWHPRPFADLCLAAKDLLRDEYLAQHPYRPPVLPEFDETNLTPQEQTERDCCPHCNSVSVRVLKRVTEWRCNGCGRHCDKPNRRMYQRWPDDKWIEMERNRYIRPLREFERKWEEGFVTSFRDRICHLATKLSFGEHDRYAAMLPGDITTRCKRCAFKEDVWHTRGKFGKSIARSEERIREFQKRRT